jgi:hypothetical protein
VAAAGDSVEVCREQGLQPAYLLASQETAVYPFAFVEPNPYGTLRYFQPLALALFSDQGAVWETRNGIETKGSGAAIAFGAGLRYPLSGFELRLDAARGYDGTGRSVFGWVFDAESAF